MLEMKENIHPKLYECQVTCGGCGSVFTLPSTMPEIHINVCGECHPFYTGKQKVVDAEGRIDKFMAKFGDYKAKMKK